MYGDYSGVTEVVALCPTRGNPDRALRMVQSFYDTIHRIGTEVILVVDKDDPTLPEYYAIPAKMVDAKVGYGVRRQDPPLIMEVEGGSLTKATNEAVARVAHEDVIIGHVGDDHVFVTPGWDTFIRDALLKEPGVAYAWDKHSSCWASAWWTNAIVIRTLGWLALPGSRHLTIDDAFMDIGAATRLTFLRDVIIQHAWDPRSKVFYEPERRKQENENYRRWLDEDFNADMARVREALGLEPQTFDTRTPPGSLWRRNWKMEHNYTLGRDEPQPTLQELEELAGAPLKPNTWKYLLAKRQWVLQARAAAGIV